MSKKKATAITLPLSRTSKIMSSAVGVESVSQDIVALATKATEIFLTDFIRRAYEQASEADDGEEFKSNVLEYNDLQALVHNDQRYEFLVDAVPKKIKFNEALRLYNETNEREQQRLEELEVRRQQEIEEEAVKTEAASSRMSASGNNSMISDINNLDNGSTSGGSQTKESPKKSSSSTLSSKPLPASTNKDNDTNQSGPGTPTNSSTAPTTPDVYSDP